jgi:chain length determinant protein EpsF
MTFNQIISIVKARWIIAALVLIVTVLVTVVISLLLPKQYTAAAAVVVDVKSPDPIAGIVLPGLMSPGYMATQVDIIQSNRVAEKVIRTLKMDQSPEMRQQWQDATKGEGSFELWLIELLRKNLDIKPSRESSVINVSYTSVSPQFAAALANAYIQAYIETTIELRVDPAKQYTTMFEEQGKVLRERVEQAQARLSDYQQKNGLLVTDERLDVETARLNDLSSQLVLIQGQTADSRSRKSQASENSSDVLLSPVTSGLRADLSRTEAKLKEISSDLGPQHPSVLQMQANIRELKSKLAEEVAKINASLTVSNSVNNLKESQVRGDLDAQRQKLLKLKAQRDEAAVLQRDVDSAQRAYENIQARLSQTALETQATQTNVSLLQRAAPPSAATFPKKTMNVAISIVLGSILALIAAFGVELFSRKLRCADDVAKTLDLPLFGTIPNVSALQNGTSGATQRTILGLTGIGSAQARLPNSVA